MHFDYCYLMSIIVVIMTAPGYEAREITKHLRMSTALAEGRSLGSQLPEFQLQGKQCPHLTIKGTCTMAYTQTETYVHA